MFMILFLLSGFGCIQMLVFAGLTSECGHKVINNVSCLSQIIDFLVPFRCRSFGHQCWLAFSDCNVTCVPRLCFTYQIKALCTDCSNCLCLL